MVKKMILVGEWMGCGVRRRGEAATHPAALIDPVAQPPLAEGRAPHITEEQHQDQQTGGGATTCCHVKPIHRPGHAPTLLLLPFNDQTVNKINNNNNNSRIE